MRKLPKTPPPIFPNPTSPFAWDAVYGQGYFLAQIVGSRIRQVIAKGDQGTTIQVECLFADPHAGYNGVAVDSNGNLYKVVW